MSTQSPQREEWIGDWQEKGAAFLARRSAHNRPQCGRFRARAEGLPKCPFLPEKGSKRLKAPLCKEFQGVPAQVRRFFLRSRIK